MSRFTWRREVRESSRMVWDAGVPLRAELRRNGQLLATVCPEVVPFKQVTGRWSWYGGGTNTAANGRWFASLDEAKADCLAHFKARDGA